MPTYATFLLGGDLSLRCLSKPTRIWLTHTCLSNANNNVDDVENKNTHTHTLIKFRHQKWVFYLQHVHFREINFYTHIDT